MEYWSSAKTQKRLRALLDNGARKRLVEGERLERDAFEHPELFLQLVEARV